MEKSPAALGMNVDEYADVSQIYFIQMVDGAKIFIDDVSTWCWNFEKEEIKCTANALDGVEVTWIIGYE